MNERSANTDEPGGKRPRTTKSELSAELEAIVEVVALHPTGVALAVIQRELASRLARPIDQRKLRRRLEQLASDGRIVPIGERRGRRYRSAEPPTTKAAAAGGLAFGGAAQRALAIVRQPLAARKPVGYDRGLLDRYEPGHTWYLPEKVRERLARLGETPDTERPAGTFARDVHSRLLIDLSWASSRLEGNTYSRLDTQNLIEFGQKADGKDLTEAQMILNHKGAIEFLIESADDIAFDRRTLTTLHAILSENLLGDPHDEGRLRTMPVGIGGSTYIPTAIPSRIEELFDEILGVVSSIDDPFEQAFFVMVHVPYLQPFIDVNKRTSRLAANIPLIKRNLCPLSFVDVPVDSYVESLLAVYELQSLDALRELFAWAYERSCAQYRVIRDSLGTPDPFRLRYRDQLREATRALVLGLDAPSSAWLTDWANRHGVVEVDRARFAETALALILNLNEGAAARYGLRPSEYAQWRAHFSPPAKIDQ